MESRNEEFSNGLRPTPQVLGGRVAPAAVPSSLPRIEGLFVHEGAEAVIGERTPWTKFRGWRRGAPALRGAPRCDRGGSSKARGRPGAGRD